jgi:hypothetical protein
VTAVRTAKEALQSLHTAAFDIVLKNHDPADGVNACRFLRKAASNIPVVGTPTAAAPLPICVICNPVYC